MFYLHSCRLVKISILHRDHKNHHSKVSEQKKITVNGPCRALASEALIFAKNNGYNSKAESHCCRFAKANLQTEIPHRTIDRYICVFVVYVMRQAQLHGVSSGRNSARYVNRRICCSGLNANLAQARVNTLIYNYTS